MMRELKEGAGRKELPVVIKGDVQGSVEAISGALEKLGNDEVGARILLAGNEDFLAGSKPEAETLALDGADRFVARRRVVEMMAARGLLVKVEPK